MQVHLATRSAAGTRRATLGATPSSSEGPGQGHGRRPRKDYQFSHHLEVAWGRSPRRRLRRGRAIKRRPRMRVTGPTGFAWPCRARCAEARRSWSISAAATRARRTTGRPASSLEQGESCEPARDRVDAARRGRQEGDRAGIWVVEVQGMYQCQTERRAAGLKLLAKAADEDSRTTTVITPGATAPIHGGVGGRWSPGRKWTWRRRRSGDVGPRPGEREGGPGVAGAVQRAGPQDEAAVRTSAPSQLGAGRRRATGRRMGPAGEARRGTDGREGPAEKW